MRTYVVECHDMLSARLLLLLLIAVIILVLVLVLVLVLDRWDHRCHNSERERESKRESSEI